jgi:hypothetical protein
MPTIYDHESDDERLSPTATPPHGLVALEARPGLPVQSKKCKDCELYRAAWVIRGGLIGIATLFLGISGRSVIDACQEPAILRWVSAAFSGGMGLFALGCWWRFVCVTRLQQGSWDDQ